MTIWTKVGFSVITISAALQQKCQPHRLNWAKIFEVFSSINCQFALGLKEDYCWPMKKHYDNPRTSHSAVSSYSIIIARKVVTASHVRLWRII